jgi:hypothetical protein
MLASHDLTGAAGMPKPDEYTLTTMQVVEMVASMLLAREGETLTQALAFERARNIAQALAGTKVLP